MKSKLKAARIACFTLGTALLLTALFLVVHNTIEDKQSGEKARTILHSLKEEIPEYTEPLTTMPDAEEHDLFSEYEAVQPHTMETLALDGNVYIGYIAIPEIGIELPVLADWSYPDLKIAPCRYVGDLNENDLIICAHNYTTHFGRIGDLHTDSEIIFTDTEGKEYRYSVVNIEQYADMNKAPQIALRGLCAIRGYDCRVCHAFTIDIPIAANKLSMQMLS